MKRGVTKATRRPQPAPGPERAPWEGLRQRPLWALALGLGVVHVGIVIGIALARIGYPFQLDWLEGALLEQVERVRSGLPLYVEPSVSFVPLVYTPLYTFAGAAASWFVGPGFMALRSVSVIGAAVTCVLIGRYVVRATGHRLAGFMAIALYAAGQHLAESWLDVGRSDSLYLVLILGGVTLFRARSQRTPTAIGAGIAWMLALLTKQSAPIVLAPLLLWLLVREGKRGRIAVVSFALASAAALLALELTSAGWFHYYVLVLPAKFALDLRLAGRFFHDMLPMLPAIAVVAVGLWARVRARAEVSGFHLALAGGLALGSWYLRLYPVAGENDLLPGILAVALLSGLAMGWLASSAPVRRVVTIGVPLLLCLQLGLLFRDPRLEVPSAEDREAGEDLVRRLAAAPGPVYVSYGPYLLRRAGRPTHAHIAPLMDMVRAPRDAVQERLWSAVRDSLRARRWSLLVLDRRDWLRDEAEAAGYREMARVFRDPEVFWPVTGYHTRPEWVMAPAAPPDTSAPSRSRVMEPAR